MARSRNIKPSFFTNDVLSECQPLARLLFAGLWTVADREGRLEDRPKKIKAEVLPYDDCDCESLLNELAEKGFILRYSRGDNKYIQILSFAKHQNPHVKEGASTIPAPDLYCASNNLGDDEPGLNPITDSLNPITEDLVIPEWLDRKAWENFCEYRGKTFKHHGKQIALGKLTRWRECGHDPTEILNNSIMNGWKGLFEPKEKPKTNRKAQDEGMAMLQAIHGRAQ